MSESDGQELFDIVDNIEQSSLDVFFKDHYDVPINYAMVACQRLAARMASDIGITPLKYVRGTRQLIQHVENEKRAMQKDHFFRD